MSLKFQWLIQFVYDNHYPSKKDIIAFLLTKDLEVAPRSLDRYISLCRADFGIEITYSPEKKGYYIDEEKSIKVASFFKYLEIVQLADIFSNSLKESNNILEFVSFDDSKNFKGIDQLKDILIAIKQEKEISFIHENYGNNLKKEHTVTPLILKEYLNRWYVIAAIDKGNETRTFGVDRIFNIKIGKTSNKKKSNYIKKLEKFKHTIGVTYNEGEPEKVSLLVNELHVKYMRSLPLHQSQVILPQNSDKKHQVDFYIYPNYEFKTQILKIGPEVEVLSPQHLRDEIKGMLERSLNNYR